MWPIRQVLWQYIMLLQWNILELHSFWHNLFQMCLKTELLNLNYPSQDLLRKIRPKTESIQKRSIFQSNFNKYIWKWKLFNKIYWKFIKFVCNKKRSPYRNTSLSFFFLAVFVKLFLIFPINKQNISLKLFIDKFQKGCSFKRELDDNEDFKNMKEIIFCWIINHKSV